jgi:hypothetical protein
VAVADLMMVTVFTSAERTLSLSPMLRRVTVARSSTEWILDLGEPSRSSPIRGPAETAGLAWQAVERGVTFGPGREASFVEHLLEDFGASRPDHERTTVRSMCIDIEPRGQFARRCQPVDPCIVGSGIGMSENMFDYMDLSVPTGSAA